MAPWDELQYYDLNSQIDVTIIGQGQYVLTADSRRVLIGISTSDSTYVFLTQNAAALAAANPYGFAINNLNSPFRLGHDEWPSLPQQQWLLNNITSRTVIVNVTQVRLKSWPKGA